MKITKIKVSNFRLLKLLELDLEHDLSLVIGKNNCGKTSLLSLIDKFIGTKETTNPFTYNDFNIDFLGEISSRLESAEEQSYSNLGISLNFLSNIVNLIICRILVN